HPPLEPRFRNMLMRSADEGRSWSAPEPVPDSEAAGVECAGLTALPDGSVLLNQWQFGWVEPVRRDEESGDYASPEALARAWATSPEFLGLRAETDSALVARHFPLARKGGRCRISRAQDGSAPFVELSVI